MKTAKKTKVHCFDLAVYPRQLFIVSSIHPEDFTDDFITKEGYPLKIDGWEHGKACTWNVERVSDNKYGILIWLIDEVDVGTITHESIHAAHQIFQECGVTYTFDEDEHFAYLAGYIAQCIYDVLNDRV